MGYVIISISWYVQSKCCRIANKPGVRGNGLSWSKDMKKEEVIVREKLLFFWIMTRKTRAKMIS